jgi:pre-mRNA-splicing factor ATP-dependent RNA helicase DHX38/PRP16
VNMLTGIPSSLHPSSALFGLGYTPDFVTYHELIMTSKEYMSCVTAVEGEWLAELGPMFFTVKESFKTRIAHRQKERHDKVFMENEMVSAGNNTAKSTSSILSTHSYASSKRTPMIYTPGFNTGTQISSDGTSASTRSDAPKKTPLLLKAPIPGLLQE